MSDPLPTLRTVNDLRAQVADWRRAGLKIALVPTMGALHAGHLSLVELARTYADRVVVSVFVNPTQFAPNEDFSAYPRQEAEDAGKLAGHADLLYAPAPEEMYKPGFAASIEVGPVTKPLEGAFRPTHFAGVATVVAKLLNQCAPDVALFGEKDYQQLLVIRHMVSDLDLPVAIVGAPIMREADGLALSSRNAYLSAEERAKATTLNRVLRKAAEAVAKGGSIRQAEAKAEADLKAAGFEPVDYVAIRQADDLAEFEDDKVTGPARALGAAKLGRTRLIDNLAVPAKA